MRIIRPASLVFLAFAAVIPLCAQTNTFPSSGNVGIGTTSPVTLLTLNQSAGGNMLSFNGAGANATYQTYNSAGGTAYFGMEPSSGGSLNFGGAPYALSVVPAVSRKLQFGYSGGTGVAMTVDTTGNVGIGTMAPATKLDVNGDITIRGNADLRIDSNAGYGVVVANTRVLSLTTTAATINGGLNTTGNVGIGMTPITGNGALQVAGAFNSRQLSAVNDTTTNLFVANVGSDATLGSMYFLIRGQPSATATSRYVSLLVGDTIATRPLVLQEAGGNVGIGTTNPTQKLSVNGTIQAKEVIVQTGWSDYVFKPDYKLASLSEVEGAIKRDGHLPGIPSAREVAEHGVSMGEMQSKLLAKVEELTLHQIEHEKRLNEAYGRIQKLETENTTLRASHP